MFAFGYIGIKASKPAAENRGGVKEKSESEQKKRRTHLTFKHCELGTGVDLTSTVVGYALENGFVFVCAQWLDPQYGARAIIKLNHLGEPEQSKGQECLF